MSQKGYNSDNVFAIPTEHMAQWCRVQKERQEKVAALKALREFEKQQKRKK